MQTTRIKHLSYLSLWVYLWSVLVARGRKLLYPQVHIDTSNHDAETMSTLATYGPPWKILVVTGFQPFFPNILKDTAHTVIVLYHISYFAVLKIKPRALCILGKHSPLNYTHPVCFFFRFLKQSDSQRQNIEWWFPGDEGIGSSFDKQSFGLEG